MSKLNINQIPVNNQDLTPYALKNGVPSAGDDLNKLYTLIQSINSIIGSGQTDGDVLVNTVSELLQVFAAYPEGLDINSALNGKLNISALVDNLTSSLTNTALTANQGKVLKGLIDSLASNLSNYYTSSQTDSKYLPISSGSTISNLLTGQTANYGLITGNTVSILNLQTGLTATNNNFSNYYNKTQTEAYTTLEKAKLSGITQAVDYIISTDGTNFTATPGVSSGLSLVTGTNASTVINQAIANLTSAGKIVIKKGVYNISSSIIDSNVSGIIIEFSPGAKFVAINSLNAPVIYPTDVNNWQIINPEIDGNASNQATPTYSTANSNGIWIHSGNNVSVINPNIYNVRTTGVYIDGISNNSGVLGGIIHDCGWNCITLGENANGKNLYAKNVECYNASDVGISYYGVNTKITDVLVHDITGTTGYNSAHWGIAAETSGVDSSSAQITNPTIYNVNIGINLAVGCNGTQVLGGKIKSWNIDNNYVGAIFIYSNYNKISNTTIESLSGNSICLTMAGNANYNFVTNNHLTGFQGVNLDQNASYNTITGNWCKGSYAGININTSGNLNNSIFNNDNSQSTGNEIIDQGSATIIGDNIWKNGYRSVGIVNSPITGLQAMGNQIKALTVGVPYVGAALYSGAIDENSVIYNAVYLGTSGIITGAVIPLTVQGDYTAGAYNGVALYSISGNTLTRVAMSDNDANIWKANSGTIIYKPFSSTYNASAGLYYVAMVYSRSAFNTAPNVSKVSVAFNGMITQGFTNGNQLSANTYGDGVNPPVTKNISSDFANYGGLTLVGIY